MSKVSVIGAGDVGATIAYTVQLSGAATEIVLVDKNHEVAAGHAMDMNHGLFFTDPMGIRAGDFAACAGSDVVIVTAGARQREGETRLELTRRNAEICDAILDALSPHLGDAVVIMVTNPVDVMTARAVDNAGLPRGRVFGSGTVLDSARFRYELSRLCDVDPRNTHAYVLGEHGDSEVFLWSRVHIAGTPLERFCRTCAQGCTDDAMQGVEERVRNSAYHIIGAKGFTNYGVALAVLRMVESVLRNEKSVLTVSSRLQGEYGIEGVCLSVPCVLGAEGIERVVETDMDPREREALRRSADVVREATTSV